jgi:dTDP-4-dehydrorhamnose 3,5-epimerase
MEFVPTDLPGCVIVQTLARDDPRGSFAKTFHLNTFAAAGLRTDWREEYHSHSRRGVVRGMHFQLPPTDHAKLVYCLAGEVLDVVIDLRVGSPTFRRTISAPLTAGNGRGLYVPSGCAHGFASLSEDSLMLYKVTSVHSPDCDAGIAWDSIGFNWPIDAPLLSERDARHPVLAAFDSPFRFDEADPFR